MREIFTAKGYEVGSNYDRNGLRYAVVAEGEPTWISLEKENGEITLYKETAPDVIQQIDEQTYQPVGDILTPEELKKLQDRVAAIVDRDMVELGLQNEEADDRVFIYLASWKNHLAAVHKIEIAQEDIAAELEEIRPLTKKELIHRTAHLGMEMAASKDGRPVSSEQIEWVFNWLIDQARKKQIIPMEGIIEKYDQIKGLTEPYQFDVVDLGLTSQQAINIHPDQAQYLRDLQSQEYVNEENKFEFSAEEIQELYGEIETLFYEYQLNAFDMGLTLEEASDISKDQSDYLLKIYRAVMESGEEELTPVDAVKFEYEQIKTLRNSYQINAFNVGVSLDQAQGISQNQSDYLLEICDEDTTAEVVQINYSQIKNLPSRHQITAFLLGLLPEQSQRISERASGYLMEIYNEAQEDQKEISPEEMQKIFQRTENLEGYQKRAFNLGLSLEIAENLTQNQFNEIAAIGRSRVETPAEGESNEEADRKSFLNAYQILLQRATIPVAAEDDDE